MTESIRMLNIEIDRLKFTINGLCKERDEVDQILGKALGYPEGYPEANKVDDGWVCTGEHTICSLASEAASRLKELKDAVEQYVLRPASFTVDGTCSITVPFPEWHRLDRICGNKSRPIDEGDGF